MNIQIPEIVAIDDTQHYLFITDYPIYSKYIVRVPSKYCTAGSTGSRMHGELIVDATSEIYHARGDI